MMLMAMSLVATGDWIATMKNSELINRWAGYEGDDWMYLDKGTIRMARKIVRCKDCKWYKNDDVDGTGSRVIMWPACMDDDDKFHDNFCADGERAGPFPKNVQYVDLFGTVKDIISYKEAHSAADIEDLFKISLEVVRNLPDEFATSELKDLYDSGTFSNEEEREYIKSVLDDNPEDIDLQKKLMVQVNLFFCFLHYADSTKNNKFRRLLDDDFKVLDISQKILESSGTTYEDIDFEITMINLCGDFKWLIS